MLRSRRIRSLLAAPLALGLVLLAPTLALAEDEPAPKRVRIQVEKQTDAAPAKAAPQADPMQILHHWLLSQLEKRIPEGKDLEEGLKEGLEAWFGGGQDVPLAGLRDAFKAHGWDAQKLWSWMGAHMAAARSGLFGPGMQRSFAAGPMVRGFVAGPGAGFGPMAGGRMRPGAAQQGGACPHCGGQGARTRTGFGQAPMRGRGPFGMRGGRFGMRGPMRRYGGMPGFRMGAMRGPFGWQSGPGFGRPGRSMTGGMAPGRVHTDRRAVIFWNDGSGWQRRELAPGTGFGPLPFGPGMPSGGGMPFGGAPSGPAPQPHGHGQPHGQPHASGAPGGMSPQALQQVLELLKSLQGGAGKPGAAGQPGQPGTAGGINAQDLQRALELLKQLRGQGAKVRIQGLPGGGDASSFMELLRRLLPGAGPEAAQPKRVRIKSTGPKKLEVIEETESK